MSMASISTPRVMLHLGLGSFHRAHQAVYLHRLIASGDASWVLAGGNIRRDMAETLAALQAQGGVYTVETVTPAGERSYQRIASIKTIVPHDAALSGLIDLGARADTRILSFTVTEAGYYLDAEGRLDLRSCDLRADLQAGAKQQPGSTIYGALAAILRERRRRGAGPVTLLNCDNLRHSGDRARAGLLQFIEQLGDADLQAWVAANTTSPNAMVDRITPRPTPDIAGRVHTATGWADAAPVMAESFIQWVIEDRFANGRPAWEKVGVQMVASVAPYEEAKIRLLNASHSAIAWAGTLAGTHYIHEGACDAQIRRFAFDYATDDAIPALSPSPVDLPAYRDAVLQRFGNAALCDTNQRVAMDGFSKIPGFIAPTVRERLAQGQSVGSVAMLPALFLACLQRWSRGDLPYAYEDQAMDPAVAHAICASADPVAAFCANQSLWGDLAGNPQLCGALRVANARVSNFIGERLK